MSKNTQRICGLLARGFFLAVFGTMVWTSVREKSATWDEPDGLMAAWMRASPSWTARASRSQLRVIRRRLKEYDLLKTSCRAKEKENAEKAAKIA